MSSPPMQGRETDDLADLGFTRSEILSPKPEIGKALDDAQQGLDSLLNPPKDHRHSYVITSSSSIRNDVRGRVAGPAQPKNESVAARGDELSASLEPHASLPAPLNAHLPTVTQATNKLQKIRDRAQMLVVPLDEAAGLDAHAAQTKRRAAAKWLTRYTTHAVILLVVGLLVAFGGLRTLTVSRADAYSLSSAGAFTGTDFVADHEDHHGFGDDNGDEADIDSPDFEITLPRTELGGIAEVQPSDLTAQHPQEAQLGNPDAVKPDQAPIAPPAPVKSADVNRYAVAEGDTVQSVAAKFNVMPETVMGSNGMFDPAEELVAGRVLIVPPVDGMYYVVAPGDTLEDIAHKFQVNPDVITSYTANKVKSDGTLDPNTPLVVPGGMMPERETTVTYTVRRGDTLKRIAARFGIDVPTMLNSNDIPDPDNLQPGSTLRVLPVQGLEYKVRKGDTLTSIANRYGSSPQMILDYPPNRLNLYSDLQIDQTIMIPGGSPPEEVVVVARVAPAEQNSNSIARPGQPNPQPKVVPKPKEIVKPKDSNPITKATGRMVWPVDGRITQYFSRRHNGLDIATRAGTPLHAADAGQVIWSGWRTDGLGYCVMINHHNGLTTVYGHMLRQPPVYVGQNVKRGQVIGYLGSTGRSTGPHVHFMVKAGGGTSHDYRNPLSYLGR